MPAHRLDDEDAAVRLRGRVAAIDGFGGHVHRGVEAERVVGAVQVVVDRLRHADDGKLELGGEPRGHAERILAADRHERVELLERLAHAVDAAVELVGVRARRADDRPALVQDPRDLVPAERLQVRVDHPAPAVQHANRLVPVLPQAAADGADDRIQARAIAAPSEHPHPHGGRLYIRSGASTPTSCRLSAITTRVARQSASRNASCSEPSTRHSV